jgi:O-antigen ligase
MLLKEYRRMLELLLILGLFTLSNFLVFIVHLWLIPDFVLLTAISWLLLTALVLWTLHRQQLIPKFLEHLRKNWFLLPFLVFSGLSIVWSVFWQISFYRWLILLCTIVTGGYIGLRYDLKEIIRLMSVFGIFILFLGSILVFFVPRIGVMNYYSIQGAWKGVFWHKNHMGLMTTFINFLFLINVIYSQRIQRTASLFWGILYVYSLLFVYQTDSVAAYLTAIILHGLVALALLLLKFREKIRKTHVLIFIAVLLFASLILYFSIGSFFRMFNRDTTLTGRIPMWTYIFNTYLNERPLAGYGFNAFWYIDSHRLSTQQAAGYPGEIIIADNGFIDLLMNNGYAGLFLFLILYGGIWWRSIQYASKATNITGFFPAILMLYTLVANISWSLIFENESFFMLTMVAVLFCVSNGLSPNKTSAKSPGIKQTTP